MKPTHLVRAEEWRAWADEQRRLARSYRKRGWLAQATYAQREAKIMADAARRLVALGGPKSLKGDVFDRPVKISLDAEI